MADKWFTDFSEHKSKFKFLRLKLFSNARVWYKINCKKTYNREERTSEIVSMVYS